MKDKYIFGGGDSDGLLGIATILRTIDDAFFSFTSPRTLHTEVSTLVKGAQGMIYIVDLAVDASTYGELFREIKSRPGFTTYFFDQHNLPKGVSIRDLPFTNVSIDDTISSCENAYIETDCDLNPMIPAIASLNDGFRSTKLIREAERAHGDRLYRNAKILKFGLAFNIKDNKFKRGLVYAIKSGKYPDEITELIERHELGVRKWGEIIRMAESRVRTCVNLAYGTFPNLRGGYANMLAAYLAEMSERVVGVVILETDGRMLQKMNIISNDPSINIGAIVHEVAVAFRGAGGGSVSSAGATLNKYYTQKFLNAVDVRIGGAKRTI